MISNDPKKMMPPEIEEQLHEVYKEEEFIVVKMRVKDYRSLMAMIQRDQSMGIVAKYVLSILGGIITVIGFFNLDVIKKFIGG